MEGQEEMEEKIGDEKEKSFDQLKELDRFQKQKQPPPSPPKPKRFTL